MSTYISTIFVLLVAIIIVLLLVMIYRVRCLHVAFKQREKVRWNLIGAYMDDAITSNRMTTLTELLYSVPVEKHARQLIWFDAPCIIYDERLWPYFPQEMFEGYDEDVSDPEDIGLIEQELHQFDQVSRDVVETEHRKTFVIPDGMEAVHDAEGRATGEVRHIKEK